MNSRTFSHHFCLIVAGHCHTLLACITTSMSDVQGSCQQKQDGRRKRETPEDVEDEVHEDAESVKDADFVVGPASRSKKQRGVDEVHTVPVTSTDAPTEG